MNEENSPNPAQDFVLTAIVRIVNQVPGMGIGITISTKGLLVTGIAVGWKEYYQGVAAELRDAGKQSPDARTIDALASGFDLIVSDTEAALAASTDPEPDPSYVHLKDARWLLSGTQVPADRGVWWRTSLTSVDGFTLGQLGATPSSS